MRGPAETPGLPSPAPGATRPSGGGSGLGPAMPGLPPSSLSLLLYEMGVLAGRISWSIMGLACGTPDVLPACPAGEKQLLVLLQLWERTEGEREGHALLLPRLWEERPSLLAPGATRGHGPTCWNANTFGMLLQSFSLPSSSLPFSPPPCLPFLSLTLIIKARYTHYRKVRKWRQVKRNFKCPWFHLPRENQLNTRLAPG